MSWNKNTLNFSQIDTIIEVLITLKEKYTLISIGRVKAFGLNDSILGLYSHCLRKLTYKNQIIIEQMQRTSDCDSDDLIVSLQFTKEKLPKRIPLEIYLDMNVDELNSHTDKYFTKYKGKKK